MAQQQQPILAQYHQETPESKAQSQRLKILPHQLPHDHNDPPDLVSTNPPTPLCPASSSTPSSHTQNPNSLISSPLSQDSTAATPTHPSPPPLRRSTRPHHPPPHLSDYLYNTSLTTPTLCSSSCRYPLSDVVSLSYFSDFHRRFLLSLL
ncbi:hypothetical protein PIB30_083264 [Stylosanthes scabra]|uniref:Uncharacterized protein n=1 Tax=Stylosanthes scabra TaxID=79078 RepID=A0ABU6ZQT9_9FABA|nr:hypothetical protein [Stylosanthes scabra]